MQALRHRRTPPVLGARIVCALISSLTVSNAAVSAQTVNSLQTIVDDMALDAEASPHGVPWDWALHPRINVNACPKSFRAIVPWGQLYQAKDGTVAPATRVEIKPLRLYIFYKSDRRWHELGHSDSISGAAYREDFSDDVHRTADVRTSENGFLSTTAGGGYNFHFWPKAPRSAINLEDVIGIFVTTQARLLHGPMKTGHDGRDDTNFVMSVGADLWLNATANWDHHKTNCDVGIGRFKRVTTEWRAYNMTTLTAAELQQNPPPLE